MRPGITEALEILPGQGVNRDGVGRLRVWARQVLEKIPADAIPSTIRLHIWKSAADLHAFYGQERQGLGVDAGQEIDFLATHEAWRGFPRIHICQDTFDSLRTEVARGVLHHELAHAICHGTQDYYVFGFSQPLHAAGASCGMDFAALRHFIYLLSVAVKDGEVVEMLTEARLSQGQCALLDHLLADTAEERQVWELVRNTQGPRKLAMASFLKTVLPVEVMSGAGAECAGVLKLKLKSAYDWLGENKREALSLLAGHWRKVAGKPFQERLERTALRILNDPAL